MFENYPTKSINFGSGLKILQPFDWALNVLAFKLLFETYLLTPTAEIVFKFIRDALRDLVPSVQLEKREKHPWRSINPILGEEGGIVESTPINIRECFKHGLQHRLEIFDF